MGHAGFWRLGLAARGLAGVPRLVATPPAQGSGSGRRLAACRLPDGA